MDKNKNPNAVALGRLGGLMGGPARAAVLSSDRRKEISNKAAITRWKKYDKNTDLNLLPFDIKTCLLKKLDIIERSKTLSDKYNLDKGIVEGTLRNLSLSSFDCLANGRRRGRLRNLL